MEMSREAFGQGRVHLEQALQLAIIMSKAKKYDNLEMQPLPVSMIIHVGSPPREGANLYLRAKSKTNSISITKIKTMYITSFWA